MTSPEAEKVKKYAVVFYLTNGNQIEAMGVSTSADEIEEMFYEDGCWRGESPAGVQTVIYKHGVVAFDVKPA